MSVVYSIGENNDYAALMRLPLTDLANVGVKRLKNRLAPAGGSDRERTNTLWPLNNS